MKSIAGYSKYHLFNRRCYCQRLICHWLDPSTYNLQCLEILWSKDGKDIFNASNLVFPWTIGNCQAVHNVHDLERFSACSYRDMWTRFSSELSSISRMFGLAQLQEKKLGKPMDRICSKHSLHLIIFRTLWGESIDTCTVEVLHTFWIFHNLFVISVQVEHTGSIICP